MKDQIYKNYITTHFGSLNKGDIKEYETYLRYFRRNYERHMPKSKEAKILDVGCGMGHFLYFLEKSGYRNYLGIDVGIENVEFCCERGLKARREEVFSFLRANQEPLDLIVLNDVLEHFHKEEIFQLIKLIYDNLSEQGAVVIKVPNAANPILASSSRYYDFTHECIFTQESLSQVLKVCCFGKVNVYPQDIYVFYTNPVNYVAKGLAWLSFVTFRLLFFLYGRKTTRIFTKDLIAVAQKGAEAIK